MSDIEDVLNKEGIGHTELSKLAIKFSDGVILDDQNVDPDILEYTNSLNIPILKYQGEEYKQAYSDFYNSLME
jgi:starch synthase